MKTNRLEDLEEFAEIRQMEEEAVVYLNKAEASRDKFYFSDKSGKTIRAYRNATTTARFYRKSANNVWNIRNRLHSIDTYNPNIARELADRRIDYLEIENEMSKKAREFESKSADIRKEIRTNIRLKKGLNRIFSILGIAG